MGQFQISCVVDRERVLPGQFEHGGFSRRLIDEERKERQVGEEGVGAVGGEPFAALRHQQGVADLEPEERGDDGLVGGDGFDHGLGVGRVFIVEGLAKDGGDELNIGRRGRRKGGRALGEGAVSVPTSATVRWFRIPDRS